jgi:hypothetical protein
MTSDDIVPVQAKKPPPFAGGGFFCARAEEEVHPENFTRGENRYAQ